MASFSRSTTVDWSGSIMEGKGVAKAATGAFNLPVTFPSRIGEPAGTTSPEELMAASHAACYSMALNGFLGRRGGSAGRTVTTVTIHANKDDAGIKVTTSKIHVVAENLSGIDEATFREVANEAKAKCPISVALAGSLDIQLEVEVR